MNSFRAVYRALEYEVERQREVAGGGQARIVQETRGWVEDEGQTVSQRTQGVRPRLPLLPRARPAAAATSTAT